MRPQLTDLVMMRFTFSRKGEVEIRDPIAAPITDVAPREYATAFGGSELPYLKSLQSFRLYVENTFILAKPARYRCFTPAAAWSDGDRVLADLMQPLDSVAYGGVPA